MPTRRLDPAAGHGDRGRAAGIAVAVVLAVLVLGGLLVALGPVLGLWSMNAHQDDRERAELEQARRNAAQGESRLRAAAADGTLTDAEIHEATAAPTDIQRAAGRLVVTWWAPGFAVPTCQQVDLPLPLTAGTAVTRTELAPCPVPFPA